MENPPEIYRTYRFRIYPTKGQRFALENQLAFACDLYNAALEQRRYAWRQKHHGITLYEQYRDLTDVRASGIGPTMMSCSAMRSPLQRVDWAFRAFFRRVQAGETPGYPRFRSRRRCDSLTWDSAWSLRDGRLALQGVGHIKVNWHRALPVTAKIRGVTVRRSAGRWHACFTLAVQAPTPSNRPSLPNLGLDLGVQTFAALSTGELVKGPRAYRSASRRLRIAQRRVTRRAKGSLRRNKASLLLARKYERIRNIRRNHAHQLSRRLVSQFGLIAVEDLNVRGLSRGRLAKDVRDSAWAEFVAMLDYKAEDAGIKLVKVPPSATSQICSDCQTSVVKSLKDRMHRCPNCGLVLDRDVNAARNILRLGMSRQAPTWPTGACVA